MEIIVAMVIASVLFAVALPAYQRAVDNHAIRSTAADLVTAVNTARAQAVNLRGSVTVESRNGNWNEGWFLEYPAGAVVQAESYVSSDKVDITETDHGGDSVTFSRQGTIAQEVVFELCRDRTGESGRRITISRFGRVTNEILSCI